MSRTDVVILGAGLAGLTLARHLLLETEKTVLLLERRPSVPPPRQKVGESTVQLAGYYLSKVLDLEEHLLRRHFMKYNLRFCWRTGDRDAPSADDGFESYSQSFIRPFSNIASYQVNRNDLEAELLRLNLEQPRFTFAAGVKVRAAELAEAGDDVPHRLRYERDGEETEIEAGWVVDTTGRSRFLARRLGLVRRSSIRHGSFFWWVDGLVDVEKLTGRSRREVRQASYRRAAGHLPAWLSTCHFLGEGFWFWVIPLHGKTSLGLVYDSEVVDHSEVFSVDKATDWVCRRFPLFARDLPRREVLDFGGFRDFSYDCAQTVSPARWALAGESGRFNDPLYSPGSDLIAIHNTLIVDAIETGDAGELANKCARYEQLMRAVYSAYVPSYTQSYDVLGDQEAYVLKYSWELLIYFAFYVFPFVNELLTDRRFGISFLRSFARLGPLNRSVQQLLSGYYQWKKASCPAAREPRYFDFTEIAPLAAAEKTFYRVGAGVDEARQVLAEQLQGAEELARFIYAHVASVVVNDARVLLSRRFVEDVDLETMRFDPEEMAARWRRSAEDGETFRWSFDPFVLERFHDAAADREEDSVRPAPRAPANVLAAPAGVAATAAGVAS